MLKQYWAYLSLSSLRTRIMLSALMIILIVLPGIGIALNNAFEQQIRTNEKSQLAAYFYSVLALTEMEDNQVLMPEVLLENQFNVINSGLYALITRTTNEGPNVPKAKQLLWFSNSFLGTDIDPDWLASLPNPALGKSYFMEFEINNEAHFVYSFSVRFDQNQTSEQDNFTKPTPITLHIIKDLAAIQSQVNSFSQQLWTYLLALMAILVLIQICWLIWTLRPLAKFTRELQQVQHGELAQLSQAYPSELNAVARQLNALLNTEKSQRQRYRNALDDLAHSLKTPLAAILSQQDLSDTSTEQIEHINQTISHQLKRAQSAGNNAWHLGIKVQPVLDKLLRTLVKIYPDRTLQQVGDSAKNLVFRGDESDLTEILGNLLDNACKASASQVHISCSEFNDVLTIKVEDDGKGVTANQKKHILKRGTRADTYDKGHGIGLAIVRDLVAHYQGTLQIDASEALGGACFTITFS